MRCVLTCLQLRERWTLRGGRVVMLLYSWFILGCFTLRLLQWVRVDVVEGWVIIGARPSIT